MLTRLQIKSGENIHYGNMLYENCFNSLREVHSQKFILKIEMNRF